MSKIYNLLGFLASLAVIAVLLITSLELVAYYEPGFYEREYEKYQVCSDVDMEMEDVLYVTEEMMDYLKGKRGDLDVETVVGGEEREFFNEREKAHMEDVRLLFLGGMKLRRWLLLLAAFCIGILVCMEEKPVKRLAAGYVAAFFLVLLAAGGLSLAFIGDFTQGFTAFHHIFFDNDLWILNPETDLLINILPEGFFQDFAVHMLIAFGAMAAVLLAVSIIALVLGRRRRIRMEMELEEEEREL